MSRFARKIDRTQRAVVAAFKVHGCSVQSIQGTVAGVPDLVVGLLGRTHLVEVKPDERGARGKPRPAQEKFAIRWRGGLVHLVRNAEDVNSLVRIWRNQHDVSLRAASALATVNSLKTEVGRLGEVEARLSELKKQKVVANAG